MADEFYNVWSDDDTTQSKKRVKLIDNLDGTFSLATRLENVTVSESSLDVHVKAIHTNAVNQEFHQETATFSNFASTVTSQDRSFDVDDATGFAIGDIIQIENGTVEPHFPTITNIVSNTITINRPIDRNYTTADGIRKVITNMAVLGSVGSPQAFSITGEQSTALTHITRVIFEMTHAAGGDLSRFGDILGGLTNGVVVRVFKGDPGVWKTITVWKTNADMKRDMYNVEFDDRSLGSGDFGTSGRATFTEFGMVGEYNPAEGDKLELLIQDDLTTLITFKMNAQGHTED